MKKIASIVLAGLCLATAQAQTVYNWKARLGVGSPTYIGNPEATFVPKHYASYQFNGEYRLNNGLGAFIGVEGGHIGGDFDKTATSAIRNQNFRTGLTALSGGVVLHLNNDRIMRLDAPFAPYFGVGAGMMSYAVKSDQKAGTSLYDYSSASFKRDETFETVLVPSTTVFSAMAVGGVDVRISDQVSFYTALTAHYPLTDGLDGSFASKMGSDLVLNGTFGFSVNFGRSRRDNFTPPVFSYIETTDVLPPSSYQIDPFGKKEDGFEAPDSSKIMNNELTALKQKVAAMEGDMANLRNQATDNSGRDAEMKRMQEEVTKLNTELERAKSQIAGMGASGGYQGDQSSTPRDLGGRDNFNGVRKENYPYYFAYPPASLDGVFAQLAPTSLTFSGSASQLVGENKNQLVNIPDLLARYPNLGVTISAYSRSSGGESANLATSKKRAMGVEQFFLRNGATSRQVISNYYGNEDPNAGDKVKIEFIKLR